MQYHHTCKNEPAMPETKQEVRMMLKLTTMNLKGFLTELAACCGGVTAEIAGAPVNLNNTAQLRRMYEQDGSLTLELNVSSPKDYMRLACFAIGDC